jgi:hypothetical protein
MSDGGMQSEPRMENPLFSASFPSLPLSLNLSHGLLAHILQVKLFLI